MSLFIYSRADEEFIDAPHVSIKVGTGCPAGCDCQFSYKNLKKDILYSKESIIRNIRLSHEKFSSDFDFFIVGLNILGNDFLFDILDTCLRLKRNFKLQISQDITSKEIILLNTIYEKYGKFDCSLPKTIDSKQDLIGILHILKKFKDNNFKGKVYFDVFIPLSKYENIIESFIQKLSTTVSNNKYNCIMGDSFDIKFHDLSWTVNKQDKIIDNLERKTCLMKEYFTLSDSDISLVDHIEIFPNGDLTFHDNLCYLGNFSISNIGFNDEDITRDFMKYTSYLNNISDVNLKKQCYKCIKNSYNYGRSLSSYKY